jgi:hypothetical protein
MPNWTRQYPTKEGWYFYADTNKVYQGVVKVERVYPRGYIDSTDKPFPSDEEFDFPNIRAYVNGGYDPKHIDDMGGYWYGPIVAPEIIDEGEEE